MHSPRLSIAQDDVLSGLCELCVRLFTRYGGRTLHRDVARASVTQGLVWELGVRGEALWVVGPGEFVLAQGSHGWVEGGMLR